MASYSNIQIEKYLLYMYSIFDMYNFSDDVIWEAMRANTSAPNSILPRIRNMPCRVGGYARHASDRKVYIYI